MAPQTDHLPAGRSRAVGRENSTGSTWSFGRIIRVARGVASWCCAWGVRSSPQPSSARVAGSRLYSFLLPPDFKAWVLGVAIVAAGWGVMAVAFDRELPREDVKGFASKQAYKRGETFTGVWTFTFVRACPSRAYRYLTSDKDPNWRLDLPPEDHNRPAPGTVPLTVRADISPFSVPVETPIGRAYLNTEKKFYCNIVQRLLPVFALRPTFPAIPFEVVR